MKCNSCSSVFPVDNADFCPYCGNVLWESKKILIKPSDTVCIHSWQSYREGTVYRDTTMPSEGVLCLCDERANDLRLIKKYRTSPDTIYFITADIKTENVVNHESKHAPMGASISSGENNCSRSILGTSDWQRVGVLGRSDENGILTVSFNLGYYSNTCSGKAWFDSVRFTPADSITKGENRWRFLAVILTNTGLDTIDKDTGERISLSHKMSNSEICAIKKSLIDFEADLSKDAEGLFTISVDTIVSDTLCTDYTKNSWGYTITNADAASYLENIGVDVSLYDHVIVIAAQPSLPARYYGLGGMNIHQGIGYSFVLHTNVEHYVEYLNGRQDGGWPPAIYIHEFLHSVEALSNALGLNVPLLDSAYPGYTSENEWRAWYYDYMHKKINSMGKIEGIDPRVWRLRPSLFTTKNLSF